MTPIHVPSRAQRRVAAGALAGVDAVSLDPALGGLVQISIQ